MKKISSFLTECLPWFILGFVAMLCFTFILTGTKAEDGSITLDGEPAKIEEYTTAFIEDANATLFRIMNEDKPTDAATIAENETAGKGFYTTIEDVLGRRLADGNNDNGDGWQCSRYTAYLATGQWSYSSTHPDYGPVNGKDVATWLVNNYGYKYIDEPVAGAIGSGGFSTLYGHTVMYLYSTGTNTAMVNDANYVPLTVSTHNMNIDGWVWVVPGSYSPAPTPTPEPAPAPTPEPVSACKRWYVQKGDTLGEIMRACEGAIDWSRMSDYAKSWKSVKYGLYNSVYDGWVSPNGVGLFAGDVIERK